MIVQDGDRLRLSGDLTLSTVSGLLDAGRAGVAAGDCIVDLADVGRVDSAALALLFAWLRAARAALAPRPVVAVPLRPRPRRHARR